MKWLIGSFVFAYCLLHITIGAFSLDGTNISVAPAILDLAGQPNESIQSVLTIRNGGESALPISITPKSLVQDDELLPNNKLKSTDASSWIEVTESEFLLESKSTKKIPIETKIPDGASPGGHYAQLSIRGLALEQTDEAKGSIVIPEIAVTVLVSVAGEIYNEMFISQENLAPFSATPSTNYLSEFSIENTGNIHDLVTPIFVVAKNNEEVYRQNLTSKIILPQTVKNFTETLQLPDEFGIYNTHIEFRYGNGQILYSTEPETLFVAPSILSMVLTGLFTVGSLYFYSHRKNIHRSWNILVGKTP